MSKFPLYYFLSAVILFTSCSQNIYYAKGDLVESRLILKDSMFKLIEKNGTKTIRSRGVYKLSDSTLTLIFERRSTLPILTSNKNISVTSKSENNDSQKMTIISAIDENPAWLAEIVLRDSNQRILKKIQPNFDGEVVLQNLNEISEIEISSQIDARTMKFNFQQYRNQNIKIKLESINWGGKTVTNQYCGLVYATQPIIIAKVERSQNDQIEIFIDEKIYSAQR